jgi:hypothetical protein
VLAGTHNMALQAAGKCAEIAYREVLSAPEGYTRANKRRNRDKMRGHTGNTNFGYVFWHS